MSFRVEIKDFIKNTLILTLFFTLVLQLSWGYVAPYLGMGVSAGNNEKNFVQVGNTYLGSIATAASLSLGQKEKFSSSNNTLTQPLGATLSVDEMIRAPKETEEKLITNHMDFLRAYAKVLSTDITSLLSNAENRATTLDEHINILKNYGNTTNERLKILTEQSTDIKNFINKNSEEENIAKATLQNSLGTMSSIGMEAAIANYTRLKNEDMHAKIYLVYIERFREIYTKMQAKNRNLLDTLTNNKDALVKNTTVVVPTSGSEILKELGVIKTEEEIKKQQSVE